MTVLLANCSTNARLLSKLGRHRDFQRRGSYRAIPLSIAKSVIDEGHRRSDGQADDEEHQAVGEFGLGYVSEHLVDRLGEVSDSKPVGGVIDPPTISQGFGLERCTVSRGGVTRNSLLTSMPSWERCDPR